MDEPNGAQRHFSGHINRFEQVTSDEGYSVFKGIMVPWLWFLTCTTDCRIFQKKNVPDIIKAVCADNGCTEIDERLERGNYLPLDYCEQYRESDFAFISRLMEREGIYYFFKHTKSSHKLCLMRLIELPQICT